MNIALVGPGIMEIPPKGWGAVESLIWDYATELGELGHEGTIINTPDKAQIIRDLTKEKYDYIHVHYDVFYDHGLYSQGMSRCQTGNQFSLSLHRSTRQTPL